MRPCAFEFLFDKWHLGPKDARFRGSGSIANPFTTDHEDGSDKASRTVGTNLAASLFVSIFLFCFAGLTLMGNASMLNGWRQFALLSMTFTAMLITAKNHGSVSGVQA
jgi:hypothetical protein